MKTLCKLLILLLLLYSHVLADEEEKEKEPQTQTKPNLVKIMPSKEIEELLKKLDELERLKRGQRFFKVLAVDSSKQGLSLINGGWSDGLKQGFRLQVFRKSHVVTTIELIEVLKEESIAKVLDEKDAGLVRKDDYAKLLPYIPPKKEVKTEDKSTNNEINKTETPQTNENKNPKEAKYPIEITELEDLLAETLIDKQKLENENKAYLDELYVLRQDVKALELELQRDEVGARIMENRINSLLNQYQLGNHLGVFADFTSAYGYPEINCFQLGVDDAFFEYSLGIDFFSEEGLSFSARYMLIQQPALKNNDVAGVFSFDFTVLDHFSLGYRDYSFINTLFITKNSREFILRAQILPFDNNIPEHLNVLEIEELNLNYGVEIAKDFSSGSGTDYRFFLGLNNFFSIKMNFNHGYWSNYGRFGAIQMDAHGSLPLLDEFVDLWLLVNISYQIALNDRLYKDFGSVKISLFMYF